MLWSLFFALLRPNLSGYGYTSAQAYNDFDALGLTVNLPDTQEQVKIKVQIVTTT